MILAPIRGVTDDVYRHAFTDCFGGFDRAIAPFIKLRRDKALTPRECRRIAPSRNVALPTVPQLHANHGPALAEALKQLHDQGHDEVNWNLGCPYPMVAKRRRGAGLLPYPDTIREILDDALADCPLRFSVKLRLGYHNPDEFPAVLDLLNQYTISEVILHPRVATQLYSGDVDLDRTAKAIELCRHPFVYNGDITSPVDLSSLQLRFPTVHAWMIGRGALWNPHLPRLIKGAAPMSENEFRCALRKLHDQLFDGYRNDFGVDQARIRMREHWTYLAELFENPKRIHRLIRHSRNQQEYADAVSRILDLEGAEFAGRLLSG